MGSRTKTYRDLSAQRMFEDKDNLYAQEMIRIYARTGSIDPQVMLPSILQDSNQFFNEKVFEHMGVTAQIDMNVDQIEEDSIVSWIRNNYDSGVQGISDWFLFDVNDVPVDSNIIKAYDYMEGSSFEPDDSCLTDFHQNLEYSGGTGTWRINFPVYVQGEHRYAVLGENRNNGFVPKIEEWPDTSSGTYWMLTLWRIENDCHEFPNLEEDNIVKLQMPKDEREVIAVKYYGGRGEYIYIYTEDLIREDTKYSTLMLVMRKNFQEPSDSKYKDFLYSRFGLNAEDNTGTKLEDSLDQPDLKDAFLTYASYRSDEIFGDWVNQVYHFERQTQDPVEGMEVNETKKPPNVVYVNGELSFKYQTTMTMNGGTQYVISYGGGTFPADMTDEDTGEPLPTYVVPFEVVNQKKLHERFQAYNRTFTMFVYSEKTVKVKWYQTTLFRMILMVLGVIFSFVFLGATAAINMLVSMVISTILQAMDPKIAALLGLVLFALTFDFSALNMGNILKFSENILKVVQTFHNVAFQQDIENLTEEVKSLGDETKEMAEEIDEIMNDAIYIPFYDRVDMMYNTVTELPYKQYEMLDHSVQVPEPWLKVF